MALPGVPSAQAQTYRTSAVPNMRKAIYRLAMRKPTAPYALVHAYTFPISPESLRRKRMALAQVYETRGPANTIGGTRVIDQYGMTPTTFVIEGTTGWQYHSTDGYQYTGLESVQQALINLEQIMALNVRQTDALHDELYLLELYDYFMNDFWEVVPVGPQEIWQDQRQPLLTRYRFNFEGLRYLGAPTNPTTSDPIAAAFSTAVSSVQETVNNAITGVESLYGSAQSVVSAAVGRL